MFSVQENIIQILKEGVDVPARLKALSEEEKKTAQEFNEAMKKINESLKDVQVVIQEFKEHEAPIAALNKAQKGKEYEVITAAGAKVAELITSGELQVHKDMEHILVKLNQSGGIATVSSQGLGGPHCSQKPYVEFFMWRKDTSMLQMLAKEEYLLVLGANRDENGYKDDDQFPLQCDGSMRVTRSLPISFDSGDDRFEQRHTELCKLTGMKISYDMSGLLHVIIIWNKFSDIDAFIERLNWLW